MSTELQYAGEYEVQRLEIQSSTGESVDLRKTYVEINLFEGIFSNALSGSIILTDTNDIVTSLPIIGQEFVNMKLRMPSDEDISIDMVFSVYKVGFKREVTKGGVLVELSLVTPETIKNNRVRVSKSYTDTIDRIVGSILEDETYINTTKNRYIEKTQGIRRIVSPNYHPYELIKCLSTEAKSQITGNPFYLFFETIEGLHFRSLESLYNQDSVGDFNTADIDTFTTNLRSASGSGVTYNLENSIKRTLSHGMNSYNDMLANVKSGMLGSKLIRYDIFNKTYETKTFKYFDDFDKFSESKIDENPIYNEVSIDRQDNSVGDFPDARIHLQTGFTSSDTSHYNTKTSEYGFTGSGIEDTLLYRQAKFAELTSGSSASISVYGNLKLNAGKIINFDMPTTHKDDDGKGIDKFYRGRFLITTLRHSFQVGNKSETSLNLVKDSLAESFDKIRNSPEPEIQGREISVGQFGATDSF